MHERFFGRNTQRFTGNVIFCFRLGALLVSGFTPPRSIAQTCSAMAARLCADKKRRTHRTRTNASPPTPGDRSCGPQGPCPRLDTRQHLRGRGSPRSQLHGHRRHSHRSDPASHPSAFPEQQQQALRDVFITQANLAELADGLGTTLGAAYLAHAHYIDRSHCTDLSQPVADVIAYANATTGAHSNAGKYFFANATTDGTTPVSPETRQS